MRYLFIEADEHKDIGGDDARDLSAKDLAFCLTFQGPWIRQGDRLESIRYRVGETVCGGQTKKANVQDFINKSEEDKRAYFKSIVPVPKKE
ncbi:hypothetical protein LTS18_005942 [Coniosporium uncinatum]|uniref:Uncharacterized protein n=1 Tax=Coniosporium uncinatum TaxID=93489 RepID=A0ACC3D441_9PEZI|nr:hypothetical protein LTS18_005942 [Coniosporium uncinatum]